MDWLEYVVVVFAILLLTLVIGGFTRVVRYTKMLSGWNYAE